MAAQTLRVYWDHLGATLPLLASSEALDFPASNLETGDLTRSWKATSTAAQWLGYDATSGFTKAPNALVIPGADYLVSIGASVDLRWSTDGTSVGTSIGALTNGLAAFPWTPITSAHLVAPDARHAVAEWTAVAKRGWYLHLYGAVTDVARMPGSWFLGVRTELPTSPSMPGRALGASRTYRGGDVETSWPAMSLANAKILSALIATLTDHVAEGFVETVAGVGYGGRPAWLYDRSGRTFNGTTGLPYVLPVLCTTPAQAITQSVAPDIEAAPVSVRWRIRR
jgi:hypothetical protein